jgi:hypothetical protein
MLDVSAADSALSTTLSGPALRFFGRIAALWHLSSAEQRVLLGGIPESTFYKYMKAPASARLSRDTLDRISHLVGIYKALNVLLPRPEAADAWIRHPNSAPLFHGRTALDRMLEGGFEDIASVRHYLDGVRGR